eukprot:Platyproteum_vivax@DN7443_c0_g1_i8.p1
MMRNFLLYLSLLVVACYANRVIMQTKGAKNRDVYTKWKYGSKNKEGYRVEGYRAASKSFLVKFEDVPNPEEFVDQFNSKIGKQIGDGYDDRTKVIEFKKASTNYMDMDEEKVYETIDLTEKDEIKIRVDNLNIACRNDPTFSIEDCTKYPFLNYIGEKAIEFLHKYKARQLSRNGSANALQ